MIVTVTLNPAVDQTAWVQRLEPGRVHRVLESNIDPAGKGINVSRMSHRLGWPTIAFGFLAGDTGNIIRKALQNEGVQFHFVRTAGRTRVNLTVVDGSGEATSFYGPGYPGAALPRPHRGGDMTSPRTRAEPLEAAVFDMDGVITRTARLHGAAWKELFDTFLAKRRDSAGEESRPFTEEDYRVLVDGKPRYEGIRAFLASRRLEIPEGTLADSPGAETRSRSDER